MDWHEGLHKVTSVLHACEPLVETSSAYPKDVAVVWCFCLK